jgi:hypothetical protein
MKSSGDYSHGFAAAGPAWSRMSLIVVSISMTVGVSISSGLVQQHEVYSQRTHDVAQCREL